MNDSWASRDSGAGGDHPRGYSGDLPIEIPLTGGGPLTASDDSPSSADDQPQSPNWRRLVGLASLGGVVIGIAVAVVVLNVGSGGDSEDGIPGSPTSTVDGFELASSITTPPTLPTSGPEVVVDPASTTSGPTGTAISPPVTTEARPVMSPTTGSLPTFQPFTGVPDSGPDSFDLEAAVARFGDDFARRSVTHIEVGEEEGTLDVTIIRDPFNNRYRLTLVSASSVREAIVDIDSELSYVLSEGSWVALPNSALVIGVAAADLADYLDRLMLGPLRPDTWAAATVQPGSTVLFPGSNSIAGSFVVELAGDLIPEWQFHAFSVVATMPGELRPERMTYLAYVDRQGDLSLVLGEAAIEDATQLITHRIETLQIPEVVLLPEPSLIRSAVDLAN